MRIPQFFECSLMMEEAIYSMTRAYLFCQLENYFKGNGTYHH